MQTSIVALTAALAAHAQEHDRSGAWPTAALAAVGAAGGWGWNVPAALGGTPLAPVERLRGYAAIAQGDLSTALFVTQHAGAVDLLVVCANESLKAAVLPRYAAGTALTTIGYSQLTTSRAAGAAALRAEPETGAAGTAWVLEGLMPWVTGALHCESVLAGAVCPDGEQVLLLLSLDAPGIVIDPPPPLLALDSTQTSRVRCEAVRVEGARLVAGPRANVLQGGGPERTLNVSATGLGLLAAIGAQVRELEGASLPAEPPPSAVLAPRLEALWARLEGLCLGQGDGPEAVAELRSEINDLLVRAAAVLLTLAKGTGYVRGHPAQRLVREAHFFCVWSATDAVRARTVARLLGQPVAGPT